MLKIGNPVPLFFDGRGNPLDGGEIWIGTPNADPATSPLTVYWDSAGTQVAAQPLPTLGGLIVNGANPSAVYVNATDFSFRLSDENGVQIVYSASNFANTASFQPLDADLTTISGQANTSYGLAFLTLANQAALRSLIGYPAPLAAAGGTMTGGIVRQGAGSVPYYADAAIVGGRIFITATGASDPTSLSGDLWFTY